MIEQAVTEDLVIEEFGRTMSWNAKAESLICFICWRDSGRVPAVPPSRSAE